MKNLEKFKELNNKTDVFQSMENVTEYADTIRDYIDLFEYLSDEEKYEIIQKDYYSDFIDVVKQKTISTITDDKIKEKIIYDEDLRKRVLTDGAFEKLMSGMQEESLSKLFKNKEIFSEFNVSEFIISKCLNRLNENQKKEVLSDDELMNKFDIQSWILSDVLGTISDDNYKINYLNTHKSMENCRRDVLKTCSDETKIKEVLNRKISFPERLLATLDRESLNQFISSHKDFMKENKVSTMNIFKEMDSEKLSDSLSNIDEFNISEKRKKILVALLGEKVNDQIDMAKINPKYAELIGSEIHEGKRIIPDMSKNLEIYTSLDDYLYINPFEKDYKLEEIVELSKYCPNTGIDDILHLKKSTLEEFIEGETWVNSVIDNIDPEWTDVQKLAFIDNQVGKRISYSPNFETEVEDMADERCCWKIMTDGYGVCVGISTVEKHILDKVGIQSEIIKTENHAFLLVKNIELPTEKGLVKGDSLVDPTWNLSSQKYNAKPLNFCVSYDELRKADIDIDGVDCRSHKTEKLEEMSGKIVSLDDTNLRKVYKSIGLLREDNKFPITNLMEEIDEIDKSSNSIKEQLSRRMTALKNYCPDYIQAMESTTKIMQAIVLESSDKFNYERCIVSRVYDKQDENKEPVFFAYLNFGESGEVFYYGDKEKNSMIPLTPEQFEKRFECYDMDKEKFDNKNMWKTEKTVKISKEKSSGDISIGQKDGNNRDEEER